MTGPQQTDIDSLEQGIVELTKRVPLRVVVAQVTAIDGSGNVTVNIGGNDWAATRLLDTPVQVGDNVLVLRQAGTLTVLGPIDSTGRPTGGTVASVPTNSYMIVVTTAAGPVQAVFPASYTPTVGDAVLLLWQGSQPVAVAQGKTGAPPAPTPKPRPVTPDPPPRAAQSGTRTFPAVASDTRRSGQWRNDDAGNVIAGTAPGYPGLNSGAWFTGNRPKATLHGATVLNAWIWLARTGGGNFGPQTVHLWRVADSRRAGDLNFTADSHDLALDIGQRGWFPLPNSFAQALIDSGGSPAIRAPSGPYVRLWGLANHPMAGTVKISWTRSG